MFIFVVGLFFFCSVDSNPGDKLTLCTPMSIEQIDALRCCYVYMCILLLLVRALHIVCCVYIKYIWWRDYKLNAFLPNARLWFRIIEAGNSVWRQHVYNITIFRFHQLFDVKSAQPYIVTVLQHIYTGSSMFTIFSTPKCNQISAKILCVCVWNAWYSNYQKIIGLIRSYFMKTHYTSIVQGWYQIVSKNM